MQLDPNDFLVLGCGDTVPEISPEETVLEKLDQAEVERKAARIAGVIVGKIIGWDSLGRFLVDYPGNPTDHSLPATTAASLDAAAVGREAALMFLGGDPLQPLVIGLIEQPVVRPQPTKTAEVDGKQLVFTAEEEIVFRCGQASITLTKAGKILIRGTYLLSRSSGVNRIKGGSVQIN